MLSERFSIDSLTPSPAAINFQKLDHFNGTHIRLLTNEDLAVRIKPYLTEAGLEVPNDVLLKVTPLIRERLVTLDDCLAFARFFFAHRSAMDRRLRSTRGPGRPTRAPTIHIVIRR